MKIVETRSISQETFPLLYLGTTPLVEIIGSPTSTLFLSRRMSHGGIFDGANPDNTSVDELVIPLQTAIDNYGRVIEEQGTLYVAVDSSNRDGLWNPVIQRLQEHYQR